MFRQALGLAVGRVAAGACVLEAGTLASAVKIAAETDDLKLILLDLKMPGAVGYSGIALLHAERPQVPILVVSSADSAKAAEEARAFGAIGFVPKDSPLEVMESAISAALRGVNRAIEVPTRAEETMRRTLADLTPMQLKVLLAVIDGQLNKQIAYNLGISEATVKAHMTAVMRKLDVTNRTQAALIARSMGLDLKH